MIDTKKIREAGLNQQPILRETTLELCDEVDRLRREIEECTAWGTGPTQLKTVRKETDRLRIELEQRDEYNDQLQEQLSARVTEVAELGMAVGLATTALGGMEINPDNPVGMMQQVVEEVKRLRGRNQKLAEALVVEQPKIQKKIDQLHKEVNRLQEAPQPPTHVGKVIDEQEKEITELKAGITRLAIDAGLVRWHADRFNSQVKEINELRTQLTIVRDTLKKENTKVSQLEAELQCRQQWSDYRARQKLTEVMWWVLQNREATIWGADKLGEAIEKYGTK